MAIKFSKYRDEQHGRNGSGEFTHLVSFSELPKFVFFVKNASQSQVYLVPLRAENESPNIIGFAPRIINYGFSDGVLWLFDETAIGDLLISGEWIDTGGLMLPTMTWLGAECYYRIVNGNDIYESNVFQFANITSANLAFPQRRDSLLKYTWSGANFINRVEFAAIPHENTLFLLGFLENPEYVENVESETDGEGRVVSVFTRIEKMYNVRIIAPAYIYTALLEMKFYENRKIFDGRTEYEMISMAIEKESFFKENGFDYFVLNLKMSLDAMFG